LARLFAALGAQLVLSGRRRERLEDVCAQCGGEERCTVLPLDLGDFGEARSAVENAARAFGGLDALVLAAGISQRAYALDTEDEVLARIMEVNFRTPAAIAHHAVSWLREREDPMIVAVSSIASTLLTPYRSGYAASKRALEGYFGVLRMELEREKIPIRVVMVTPGFVRTEISQSAMAGDGSPHGQMDSGQQQGISAERCARKIVQGILAGKEEIRVGFGFRGRLGLFLKSVAPRVLQRRLTHGRVY
jgi:short-subunit dehydrogenase